MRGASRRKSGRALSPHVAGRPHRGLKLTDGRGSFTDAGRVYENVARELGRDASLDPWVRGTERRGRALYATRRSGKEQVVARFDVGGKLKPTKGAGEQYYGQFIEEYQIEIPVFLNVRERNALG